MKIDQPHKALPVNTPQKTQSASEVVGKADFAEILGASMQEKAVGGVEKSQSVQSLAGPDPRIQIDIQSVEWRAADGMLDALEAYRNQLSNPEASLKKVEPYVDRMKDLLNQHQPLLNHLSEGSPVKQALEQAMVQISKEIERFRMGYYVDG